jgi:hypothetical protein
MINLMTIGFRKTAEPAGRWSKFVVVELESSAERPVKIQGIMANSYSDRAV